MFSWTAFLLSCDLNLHLRSKWWNFFPLPRVSCSAFIFQPEPVSMMTTQNLYCLGTNQSVKVSLSKLWGKKLLALWISLEQQFSDGCQTEGRGLEVDKTIKRHFLWNRRVREKSEQCLFNIHLCP